MELLPQALQEVAQKLHLPAGQVHSVLELMIKEECTIPFIVRYRKERTGGLDEVVIRQIHDAHEEYHEREKRRTFILEALKKQEALTPELERAVKAASNLQQLEDLYTPYKSKRKTKAQMAREKGLGPLADLILTSALKWNEIEAKAQEFVPGPQNDVASAADAITGASDVIVEMCSHHQDVREGLRRIYWEEAEIVSVKRADGEKEKDYLKYKDFFEHREQIKGLRHPKASHRYLAMRRGQKSKILKVDIEHRPEYAHELIQKKLFLPKTQMDQARWDFLTKCAERANQFYLHPSLDLEIKTELKTLADSASIDVFSRNLKNLLLAPYLGTKTVMGVDPGIRTGCKIVVIDETGKLLIDQVVYPFEPKNDVEGSKRILELLVTHYRIEHVAIGNGTNGRETLQFFKDHIEAVKAGTTHATLISEAGASIYSASDLAREEFPDKDPTVRGAVSIARRFQDPLAELVKIDPKSIGVGQYQHDVNQTHLKKSLTEVVETCVNFVGVDLNTASAQLISYISGMNKTLGQNIIQYRQEKGKFHSREDLMNVPRFTPKVFQQCAGFLRIYESANPLDSTFIHPESYPVLNKWSKDHNITLKDLVKDVAVVNQLASDEKLKSEVGEMTLQDIVQSLKAPSQDPRKVFESMEFTTGIRKLEDVKIGQKVRGVVTNITMFGAFIDIGVKEQGLIHISELSSQFIENAFDHLQVGQELEARVLSIDLERRRLGLSCKPENAAGTGASSAPRRTERPERTERSDSTRPSSHHSARGSSSERPRQYESAQRPSSARDNGGGRERDQNPRANPYQNQKSDKGAERPQKSKQQQLINRPFAVLKNLKIDGPQKNS